ncbi:MAG: ribonuclease, partial [Abditibacteriota bacterium]|nr:ribonuclease [Abditibacteriota bacterium]
MSASLPSRSNRIATRPGLQFECELWLAGHAHIAGVDEAGRGPLAGPVVAGAVILPPDFAPAAWPLLNDSKQIKPAVRAELFTRLIAS